MAATLKQGAHPLTPFHWEIEFPEVFARENGGFDAIVGNPPFLGRKANLATENGDCYAYGCHLRIEQRARQLPILLLISSAALRTLRRQGVVSVSLPPTR